MWTRSVLYMRESFVGDQLRESVPSSKVAARLRLDMWCWCWALTGLLALLQERFMSKCWHWSKVEAWNFTIKTFTTCQFKCLNSAVVFPSPNKISSYTPGCTSTIVFTKRSCGLFLIWSMRWLLVAVYIGTD